MGCCEKSNGGIRSSRVPVRGSKAMESESEEFPRGSRVARRGCCVCQDPVGVKDKATSRSFASGRQTRFIAGLPEDAAQLSPLPAPTHSRFQARSWERKQTNWMRSGRRVAAGFHYTNRFPFPPAALTLP